MIILAELLNSIEIKKIVFVFIVLPLGMRCFGQSGTFPEKGNSTADPHLSEKEKQQYEFISLAEAEKVLGGKAHVKDSSWKNSGGIVRYMTTFLSEAVNKKTGQNRKLFFSYEQHLQDSTAKELYASIKAENEKTDSSTAFPETGDEAFWIKDTAGNPFIMIRKANRVFKFKMYYVTDKNAFERLKTLAKWVVTDN